MKSSLEGENRKSPRFGIALPVRFNLNPDYHFVPAIRKMGVGGTIRNISSEGLLIDSQLDLLDLCQIFYEAMEDDSDFQLEMQVRDPRNRSTRIRGTVRWYNLSEPERNMRHFQAGLHLWDTGSRAIARSIVESVTSMN
jgi:hypothetical protein